MNTMTAVASGTLLAACTMAATAAPVSYTIDPDHTYPSFTADHMGMSNFRGKFNKASGTVVLDREAGTGRVDVTVDTSSLDFGHDKLNAHAKSPDMFDVAQFPTATYKGELTKFKDGEPTEIQGTLTLHGVAKPVTLTITSFKCKPHPMTRKEFCGADASGAINREDFGIAFGKQLGFDMNTPLQIQVEAKRD